MKISESLVVVFFFLNVVPLEYSSRSILYDNTSKASDKIPEAINWFDPAFKNLMDYGIKCKFFIISLFLWKFKLTEHRLKGSHNEWQEPEPNLCKRVDQLQLGAAKEKVEHVGPGVLTDSKLKTDSCHCDPQLHFLGKVQVTIKTQARLADHLGQIWQLKITIILLFFVTGSTHTTINHLLNLEMHLIQ